MAVNSSKHSLTPKPWWRKFRNTLFFSTASSAFAIYLGLVYWLNPVPNVEDLIRIPVKVLGVQRLDPHLHVLLEDETQRMMEFPVIVALKPKSYFGLSKEENENLKGCNGFVWGTPVRLTVDVRFRVWQLRCGAVEMNFDRAKKYYVRDISLNFTMYAIYWGFIVLGSGVVFVTDKRKNK